MGALYRCPGCGIYKVDDDFCEGCVQDLRRVGDVATPRPFSRLSGRIDWVKIGGALCGLLWLGALGLGIAYSESLGGGLFVAIGSLVVAGLAGWLLVRGLTSLELLLRERGRRARLPAPPMAEIQSARFGPVTVRGTLRVTRGVASPLTCRPCAAYLANQPPIVTMVMGGGAFDAPSTFRVQSLSAVGAVEVDDGSGVVARIDAGPCDVHAKLLRRRGEVLVVEGATVVVRGQGVWEESGGNRVLRIEGLEGHPPVLVPE